MSVQATKRLNKEYRQIQQNPPPYIVARPHEDNILDWHYVLTGPPDSPYAGGQYHGRVTFPTEYPFKPPRIKMCTPSGRFEVNQRLCLSMSDFHEELWNPSWSVATIINGLLSFMTGDERTTGSIVTTEAVKHKLAKESKKFNAYSNPAFREVFPEIYQQNLIDLEKALAEDNQQPDKSKMGISNSGSNRTLEVEAATEIDQIDDPEDRIRAQQLKEKARLAREKLESPEDSSGLFSKFVSVATIALIAITLRVLGLL